MDRPLTLADWHAAYRDGADPATLLHPLRAQLAARGAPVYLHVADEAALQAQLQGLQALAALHPGRAALLQACPLWGVPFVVKDNIDVAGATTTAACPAWAHTAEHHATVVQRLLAAGAVWLAKSNLDQFATGLVGTRSPYGAPSSAWSADHVSGGSSSGSAVAVAVGDVPFALGTDTAGSGRIPAGFNHIVGLKPTPGRSPTTGVLPACRTLDVVSVFALTVDDAASVLAVMEGPDPADAYSGTRPGPSHWQPRLRIGVPAELPPGVDADMAACFQAAQEGLRAQGHTLQPFDFSPLADVAALLYQGPWVAERHLVVRGLLARDPEALDPAVRQVISAAEQFSADDAFAGQYRLRALAQQAAALWQGLDVLLLPTAPHHPTHAELVADPLGANSALGVFTNFVNLLGWCALAVPAAVSPVGLPLGLTFVAPGGHDAALAQFGRQWQALAAQPLGATGAVYVEAPPLLTPASQPTLPIAAVGAHLSGLPLNWQLTDLGATLQQTTHTAPHYRLYALPGTTPPKPGLQRVRSDGTTIALEVWDLPLHQVGRFLAGIPAPLGLGSVELADGRVVHGFLCEGHALLGAVDISHHGGWRAYLSSLKGN
ncbi:MAG: allophanate hydrolase [Rubrivivax sp.]|nr:allophanate hydrolase [Rubrivivax sp.]